MLSFLCYSVTLETFQFSTAFALFVRLAMLFEHFEMDHMYSVLILL